MDVKTNSRRASQFHAASDKFFAAWISQRHQAPEYAA
jgi:hypothetical protein